MEKYRSLQIQNTEPNYAHISLIIKIAPLEKNAFLLMDQNNY